MENSKKDLIIYGFTGSVGLQALEVYKNHKHKFNLKALVCKSSVKSGLKIANELKPKYLIFTDPNAKQHINQQDHNFKILFGSKNALSIVKELENGVIVISSLSISGLEPAYYSLKAKQNIVALANKESIVCAGDFLPKLASSSSSSLIPVDSEHSAIYQLLKNIQNKQDILNIYITASGGPFVDLKIEDFAKITKQDALNHPVWSMGSKISIDSATLMNKGLEHIEACYLFNFKPNNVKALVHRQSCVHGMVALKDGSLLMHSSKPSMYYPASYAMLYPSVDTKLNEDGANFLLATKNLSFEPIDENKFKCYSLAVKALKQGKQYVCMLNHANDYLVSLFLNNKISFNSIYELNEKFLNIKLANSYKDSDFEDIASILSLNKEIALKAQDFINKNLIV